MEGFIAKQFGATNDADKFFFINLWPFNKGAVFIIIIITSNNNYLFYCCFLLYFFFYYLDYFGWICKSFTIPWRCIISNEKQNHPNQNESCCAVGMEHVDIYMFPDPTAGNPAGQVDSMVNYLVMFTALYTMRDVCQFCLKMFKQFICTNFVETYSDH